jgi:hypothetical protein
LQSRATPEEDLEIRAIFEINFFGLAAVIREAPRACAQGVVVRSSTWRPIIRRGESCLMMRIIASVDLRQVEVRSAC